jgi:hypothetical protein
MAYTTLLSAVCYNHRTDSSAVLCVQMHRGYTSETGGHASCPFDFYKTWVNAPEKAREISEALTRDADSVEDASNVTQVLLVTSAVVAMSVHLSGVHVTGEQPHLDAVIAVG